MSKGRADDAPDFGAHLRRANARRLRSASWTFAAVIVLLFAANLIVPSLRLRVHAAAQIVVALYFFALGLIARSPRATAWPTSALPLLFGLGAAATGLVFNLDLMPRVGANPAYSTVMIVACLAPLWPRRLLLAMLAPAHVLYLASVWSARQTPTFVLVMTVGGTVAVVLGWFVAALQVRAERQAFDSAAAIQRQKDELAAALARVNRLLDERREIVAIVAHDLQSPLAGIRALLRTVAETSPAEGRKLKEVARACAEMHDTVSRLIEAHAAETGEVALEAVDTGALFTHAATAAAAAAAAKGIGIACVPGSHRVLAEPTMLSHALGNLISNAIKYSPPGSVVRLDAGPHGQGVRISVTDRGPGIPPGETHLLFKKFSRLSPQPTGADPSSGLGLYIVRTLAERMHAIAGWEPNPQGGSVFFLDFPAQNAGGAQDFA